MMTRRNFEDIAFVLHLHKNRMKSKKRFRLMVESFMRVMGDSNPRFNGRHFLEAIYDDTYWERKPEQLKLEI